MVRSSSRSFAEAVLDQCRHNEGKTGQADQLEKEDPDIQQMEPGPWREGKKEGQGTFIRWS